MTRPLVVLGATGSIGVQALDVAKRLGLEVKGLASRRPSSRLAAAAAEFPQAELVVSEPPVGEDEQGSQMGRPIAVGPDEVNRLAATPGCTVVNGIVGAAGLGPTLAALGAGNHLALANKESLVAAGPLVIRELERGGGTLMPVDSEHSAIFQCLAGEQMDAVRRIVLTASGGPFRLTPDDLLAVATPEQALEHPTWNMGPRITIDSATLVNKGLEVIEAHFLFQLPYDRIDVVVHPQSVVHSLVEFEDGSLKAHLGEPDMRVPIQYALTYPDRKASSLSQFPLAGLELTFEEPDTGRFPALGIAYEAGRVGGTAPAIYNAADEVAVAAFLDGAIPFTRIADVIRTTLDRVGAVPVDSVDVVLDADVEARRSAEEFAYSS